MSFKEAKQNKTKKKRKNQTKKLHHVKFFSLRNWMPPFSWRSGFHFLWVPGPETPGWIRPAILALWSAFAWPELRKDSFGHEQPFHFTNGSLVSTITRAPTNLSATVCYYHAIPHSQGSELPLQGSKLFGSGHRVPLFFCVGCGGSGATVGPTVEVFDGLGQVRGAASGRCSCPHLLEEEYLNDYTQRKPLILNGVHTRVYR